MMEFLLHVQIGGSFEPFVWMKPTWQESQYPVILLWICSVTKNELTLPHDDQAGTIARCGYLFAARHHCHTFDTDADHNFSWTSPFL